MTLKLSKLLKKAQNQVSLQHILNVQQTSLDKDSRASFYIPLRLKY